jgi:thymidine kinase
MMNQLHHESFQERGFVTVEARADKIWSIDAVCVNCNKRFKSMHAVGMHLRTTGGRHAINFISYGNYDKKTGLKKVNRPEDMEKISGGKNCLTPL